MRQRNPAELTTGLQNGHQRVCVHCAGVPERPEVVGLRVEWDWNLFQDLLQNLYGQLEQWNTGVQLFTQCCGKFGEDIGNLRDLQHSRSMVNSCDMI